MRTGLLRPRTSSALLARLIHSPDLVQTVRALPPPTFSALIRHVGVEDAGELVALATTEQLVAAFDEDLFARIGPGGRETFDSARFVLWLEVLLEAGEELAAARVADLAEDFVCLALSRIIMVLDHDALLARMNEGGGGAAAADKAIESCLSEQIDGYLLISRNHEGWDAALSLIIALDRDHRPFLARVLDRCAEVSGGYLDDLDELATALSAADSLAEDVEAAREDRRSKQGYVEPRAARGFLAVARVPLRGAAASTERDPITRGYFRDLEPAPSHAAPGTSNGSTAARLLEALGDGVVAPLPALPPAQRPASGQDPPLIAALRLLAQQDPRAFEERTRELAYLANVLLAGAEKEDGRFEPAEAAEAVLATVGLGAEIEAVERLRVTRRATTDELCGVLGVSRADVLFRKASSTLGTGDFAAGAAGFLRFHRDLDAVIDGLLTRPGK